MAHIVKCSVCGIKFDRDKEPFVQTSARRYAHCDCSKIEEEKKSEEELDKEKLENYIMKLFNVTYINPRIRKQIKQYIEEYHYTYSGIHKALTYFYEIKNNSIEKANGGIGIVPYCYKQAFDYYYALWLAQEKNKNKVIESYLPEEIIIHISPPQRKIKKRKFFSFLDKENEE